MLDAKAREALKGLTTFIGKLLSRLGFTPNVLTTLGMLVTAVAAWRIAVGAFVLGGVLLIVGGVIDIGDGAVAKVRGTASKFGAFYDSVSDRLSDALIFSALIWFFFRDGQDLAAAVTLAAYAGAQWTSYVRARAESLGYDSRVGLMERAERLILIIAGLILGIIQFVVWALAVLSFVTVIQRVVHVMRQDRGKS